MSKMRIIPINYVDTSGILGLNQNSQYPTRNLKSYIRKKVSRSIDNPGSSYKLSIELPKVRTIDSIVIGNHNLYVGAIVRIKLYSDSFSTLAYDSLDIVIDEDTVGSAALTWGEPPNGTFGNWRDNLWGTDAVNDGVTLSSNLVHWVPEANAVDVRNIKAIEISFNIAEQFIEIGRIIAGEYLEPTHNISYGHTMSWKEKVRQYRNEGNTLRSDDSLPYRQFSFDLKTINEIDNKKIQEAFRSVGKRKDMFVSLFPFDSNINKIKDYSGILKVVKTPKITEFLPKYYSSKFILEEV